MFARLRPAALAPALAALALAVPSRPAAAQITFDFEAQAATALPRLGALTSLSITESGLTITITRTSGAAFDIVENSAATGQDGKPAGWALHSLDPFFDAVSADAFLVDFSMPVTGVSVETGDYGADIDDVSLLAYAGAGGSGALLGSDSGTYSGAFTSIATLSTGVSGIMSVVLAGGSPGSFPNSMFWDNLVVLDAGTPVVPEPATLALVGALVPAAGLIALRRRAR